MASQRNNVGKDVAFIGGLLVIAVALIVYLIMDSPDNGAPTAESPSISTQLTPSTPSDTTLLSVERRAINDPLALGEVDAPVVMVMFADYRCPFCAKFSRDTEPQLVERFVSNGTLRLEWRDFPIFGDQSMLAARAGRAAAEQGKFWDFNHAVFAVAPDRGHADLTEDALIGFAEQAGVPDLDKFTAGMRGPTFDAAINADLTQATSLGVPSTPAFIVNGDPILGAQPTEDFERAIEAAAEQS
ncbi:DsbA family protein [Mycolicibacterium gilvum]|uniref:DSBA oxidoreductase n=1 Tax=Mycolicibacterium gilvum TaxID=1804 RepID=A0A379MPP4_9MYCO|nr:thioredoxin domain-containing protein [Mycolicibacterium gilvum]MCV7056593.1 thioredoxin domain-containing protein [Mycolicibacterium gilvum]SUE32592.1 DSBA oxidoreductase [Mycolicibacterium gilvum]